MLLTATGAGGEHAELALNLSDREVVLGGRQVPAHGWSMA